LPDNTGLEADFFGVLADLEDYLPELTLVGGWVPYVYANFLWRDPAARPVFTSDVDWGLGPAGAQPRRKTIFEVLSALKYSERHLKTGKMQPVVFYRKNKTRLDFITPPGTAESACAGILGGEVAVSRLEYFAGKAGRGCAMVAQENGPDPYIDDLAADVHAGFQTS